MLIKNLTKLFYVISIALISNVNYTIFMENSIHAKDNSNLDSNTQSKFLYQNQDKSDLFTQQPEYTKEGIKNFLLNIYNDAQYANFLSFDLSHLDTFLSFQEKSKVPRLYTKSVLKLFTQKLKTNPYLTSKAFLANLKNLPKYFSRICDESQEDITKKNKIRTTLYNFFIKNSDIKKDPENYLNNLTEQIYNINSNINSNEEDDISINQLQQAVVNYLEISLNKLIWSVEDNQNIWTQLTDISIHLEDLFKYNAIPDSETLDDLFWSLIHRFCYFLELSGMELNKECYDIMSMDIKNQNLLLWTLDEKDIYITTKKEHLKRAIFNARVFSDAWHKGLITDMIPSVLPIWK